MGQCSPIKCITFLSEEENTILQWAFSLNSALAIAENWHLKGYIYIYAKGCLCKTSSNYFLRTLLDITMNDLKTEE